MRTSGIALLPAARIAAVLVALALAGCGNGTSDPTVGGVVTPTPSASSVPPAPGATTGSGAVTPAPATTGPLVEYGKQGGLAGVDDRLIVERDGAYSVMHRARPAKTGQLSNAELTNLRRLLEASHFAQLPRVNSGNTVTDGFTYRVVYQGRELLAEDGGVPQPLEDVIGALNLILAHNGD